jgi:hypothetical protein
MPATSAISTAAVKAELASLVTLNALQKQQIMPEGNA